MTNDITLTLAEYDMRRGSSLPDVHETVVLFKGHRVESLTFDGQEYFVWCYGGVVTDALPSNEVTVSKQSY